MIIEYGWLHAFLISRGENNRIKGVVRFLGAVATCEAVFHWNGVLYKNSDQLWLFHSINIRRVLGGGGHFEPSASGSNNFPNLITLEVLLKFLSLIKELTLLIYPAYSRINQ